MDIAIIVFMVLVVALCAFTVYVVITDIIRERKRREEADREIVELVETRLDLLQTRQDQLEAQQNQLAAQSGGQTVVIQQAQPQQQAPIQEQEQPQAAAEPEPQQQEATATVENPQVIVVEQAAPTTQAVVTPVEDLEGQIHFSADPKQTHRDKYLALSSQQKAWYDEIVAYAKKVETVKSVLTTGYEEYRLFSKRVIRMRIKKGTVICEFIITNVNFGRYISTNKLNVKQAPTSFKILEPIDVAAAKDSIDIAVRTILEEKEDAKRRARERRKLARQAAQAAATTTTTTDKD